MDNRPTGNRQKPRKPSKNFPMYAHARGQWAKKIRQRTYYFGDWDDPEAALQEYHRQAYYLEQGLPVPPVQSGTGLKLGQFCLDYVESQRERMEAGTITKRTYLATQGTCAIFVSALGKTREVTSLGPADFSLVAKKLGRYSPVVRRNHMKRIRSLFRWGESNKIIGEVPEFGTEFMVSELNVRLHRAEQDSKFFPAEDIHRFIGEANTIMKAMLYLGINCGLGNSDIGQLTWKRIDLKTGWLEYRQKQFPLCQAMRKVSQ